MATAPGVDDAPSESATTQASDPPPTEGQTHAMEVGDEGTHSRPASPVSTAEDDLLMGGGTIGWSRTWLTSWFRLQGAQMARVRKPPLRRHSPRWLQGDREVPSAAASRTPSKKKQGRRTG